MRIKYKPSLFLVVMCLFLVWLWIPLGKQKTARLANEAPAASLSADVQEKIDSLIRTYSQKAKGGDTQAQYRLGGFYCGEKELPGCYDLIQSLRFYGGKKSETPDDVCDTPQQYYIKYRTQDYCKNEGLPLLYSAAEKGNVDAQYSLGSIFEGSKLIPHDEKESLKWYLAAASRDKDAKYKDDDDDSPVVSSMRKAAQFYEQGGGTPKDVTKAFAWYFKAAQHGEDDTEFGREDTYSHVAGMLRKGIGTKQDIPQAISWYRKIPDGNIAHFELADIYLSDGKELPDSQSNAFAELNKLRNGCVYGWNGGILIGCEYHRLGTSYSLGALYALGQGVDRDYKAAADYFLEAANGGIREAQYNLGWLYYTGHGVLKDYKKAYMWYDLAAANGDEGAAPARDELEKYLSPADLEAAKHMAETWGKGTNTVHYICTTIPVTFDDEFIIDLDTNKPVNNYLDDRLEGMKFSDPDRYLMFDDNNGIKFEIDALSGKYTKDLSAHWGVHGGKESFFSGTCRISNSLSLEHPNSPF